MGDQYEAYVDQDVELPPKASGALNGFSFSVKDVFSIKGYTNHAGNPHWHKTHSPAVQTSPVIERLLENGAKLRGTTHTDELMYSLNGENAHYGTPVNPANPSLIPGGSSSGSAVAVAAGKVDFALGTDTGGSVRIPASYCGIFGFRPTHGAVSIENVIPLAQSFDTVGWFARNPNLLMEVGKILLQEESSKQKKLSNGLVGEDALALLDNSGKKSFLSYLPTIERTVETVRNVVISKEGLRQWFGVFKVLQGMEIWQQHGEWIETANPSFGPGLAERFTWTKTLKQKDHVFDFEKREIIREKVEMLLGGDGILIIPTAPGPAPEKGLPPEVLEERRERTMQLLCMAGLAGLPQVTMPLLEIDGNPVGLSVIAPRHYDLSLLKWASHFSEEIAGTGL
ncbi:amidase [Halobacillus sp. A5]|uniref:amidase n=1 Tax=Halobacillus sp. A5 TaxID=2880263 RepID=UPI0020A63FA7|nr:amidase [Halobacillus sp. A5]MCP3028430.1 amidase [Halobacillus sp. A5]